MTCDRLTYGRRRSLRVQQAKKAQRGAGLGCFRRRSGREALGDGTSPFMRPESGPVLVLRVRIESSEPWQRRVYRFE
jgi:hypothetical protein